MAAVSHFATRNFFLTIFATTIGLVPVARGDDKTEPKSPEAALKKLETAVKVKDHRTAVATLAIPEDKFGRTLVEKMRRHEDSCRELSDRLNKSFGLGDPYYSPVLEGLFRKFENVEILSVKKISESCTEFKLQERSPKGTAHEAKIEVVKQGDTWRVLFLDPAEAKKDPTGDVFIASMVGFFVDHLDGVIQALKAGKIRSRAEAMALLTEIPFGILGFTVEESKLIREKPVSHWVALLADKDSKILVRAARILVIEFRDEKAKNAALPVLRAALKDDNAEVRREAINGLRMLAGQQIGDTSVTDFIPLLKDSSVLVRSTAIEAVGDFRSEASAAVPTLEGLLKEDFWIVRYRVVEALAKIGKDARPAIPALFATLETASPSLKINIVGALFAIDPNAKVTAIAIKQAKEDSDEFVRLMVVEVERMMKHNKEDKE